MKTPYEKSFKNRKRYILLKEQNICVGCGKNSTDGKVYCNSCTKKRKEYAKRNSNKMSEYQKQYRSMRKSARLCIRCGKKEAVEGLTQCEICRQREMYHHKRKITEAQKIKNKENAKKRYNERKKNGICVRCGKNKAIPGKVRCLDCNLFVNQSRSGYVEHKLNKIKEDRKVKEYDNI